MAFASNKRSLNKNLAVAVEEAKTDNRSLWQRFKDALSSSANSFTESAMETGDNLATGIDAGAEATRNLVETQTQAIAKIQAGDMQGLEELTPTAENLFKQTSLTPVQPVVEPQKPVPTQITNKVNVDLSPINKSISEQTKATERLGNTIEASQNKNWELAKEHARNEYELSLASGVAGIAESFGSYLYNTKEIKYAKRNLEFEQQMQEKEMDRELVEYETALNNQLSESFANLDQASAYKNVDLSSQAIAGSKEGAVEEMGKDITNETTKMKLRKAALNLQMTYQRNQLNAQKQQLKTGLASSIVGNTLKMRKAYNDYKSYDKENFSPTIRADIRGKK